MSWADLLKSIVCVLNLIACVRLTDVSARSLAWQEPVASSLCDIDKGLCG